MVCVVQAYELANIPFSIHPEKHYFLLISLGNSG